jgi:hypothetical protein
MRRRLIFETGGRLTRRGVAVAFSHLHIAFLVEIPRATFGRLDDTKHGTSGASGERPAYLATGVVGKPAYRVVRRD